jgi:effector-binding domain-containing protein
MSEYAVHVGRVSRIPTAVIRRRINPGDGSRVVPECCGLVWNALRAQHMKGGRNVALYRDRGQQVEAGVELTTPFSAQGDIVLSQLPACTAASATHYGPYGGLGGAHRAVQEWCRANGHKVGDACWEIYGHWKQEWDADPSKIRTDVFYEIAGSPAS